jgi:uncharacterized protein YerC
MLTKGISWSQIQAATGASRATIAKVALRSKAQRDCVGRPH